MMSAAIAQHRCLSCC